MIQIEQLGQVLAQMLGRLLRIRQSGAASLSIEEIQSVYRDELDLELDLILEAPGEDIAGLLTEKVPFMDRHLEKMAGIMVETADMLREAGDEEGARNLFEKCIAIYEYLQESSGVYSVERMMKISELRSRL